MPVYVSKLPDYQLLAEALIRVGSERSAAEFHGLISAMLLKGGHVNGLDILGGDVETIRHDQQLSSILKQLVTLTSEVSYVGRTSLEAEVLVSAENPVTGECVYTNTAYLVYVALDDDGQPVQVPPLIPEDDEQRERLAEGRIRQQIRLSRRDPR